MGVHRRLATALAVSIVVLTVVLPPTAASAQPSTGNRSAAPLTFALIGDPPYGPDQVIQ